MTNLDKISKEYKQAIADGTIEPVENNFQELSERLQKDAEGIREKLENITVPDLSGITAFQASFENEPVYTKAQVNEILAEISKALAEQNIYVELSIK